MDTLRKQTLIYNCGVPIQLRQFLSRVDILFIVLKFRAKFIA